MNIFFQFHDPHGTPVDSPYVDKLEFIFCALNQSHGVSAIFQGPMFSVFAKFFRPYVYSLPYIYYGLSATKN